ncbi:phosphonate ABC transporter substrate-binding protein [Anabaena cylindrica UHCC 0172]|uniref:phosphonate ABC transporter substrate-binding protein n=1 Tax=Anabaena cylindrica TaxID=1165 RepID=UPI002B1F9DA0|nr:phosphonate ABC transporter substrate-binding protein [Anabaena cylindrica]MEA5551215.1 phosphonate ABC transporter substrate-binding protein [Anabaena cylindrica UHCC 0172]
MDRRLFIQQTSLFTLTLASTKILSACTAADNNLETATKTSSTSKAEIKEINFGILSTESQANQKPLWEPMIAAMSKEIGIPIKPFFVTQYAAVIEAMRFGKVQAAWLGGKSYIEATKNANAEVFAQVVAEDGTKGYYSHLITNKNNPILKEAKAEGGDKYVIKNASKLTFAFNDPSSTSGFLVPSYYIFTKNNIDPKKAFKRLIFAGNHEACAMAVANQQIDVATVSDEALARLALTNPQAREKIEIIWKSTMIPSDPLAYRQDLSADIKKKFQDFFYNYKDKEVLAKFKISGFAPAEDKMWNPIRELDISKQIQETKSKDNLSAEEKKTKLDELNKQLKEVQSN